MFFVNDIVIQLVGNWKGYNGRVAAIGYVDLRRMKEGEKFKMKIEVAPKVFKTMWNYEVRK